MRFKKFVFPVLLLISLFFFAGSSKAVPAAQINKLLTRDTIPLVDTADGNPFEKVEIEAKFPGGDAVWRKFLENNLNPEVTIKHKAPAGIYTVIVQFVVDKEGRVSDIKALTNHGYGMEEEVIRLLKKAPRWEPAIQDGRQVKAYRKQPVTFQVIDDRKKKKNKD
jgi:TonB family protein